MLGFRYSKALAFELGYLNQIVAQRTGRIFEYNHTLLASITFNFDFPAAAQNVPLPVPDEQ